MCSYRLQRSHACWFGSLLLGLLLVTLPAQAQPSGGPYGPLQQTYDLPAEAAHIYYAAPEGKADAPGTTLAEPTTLEAAIAKSVTNPQAYGFSRPVDPRLGIEPFPSD